MRILFICTHNRCRSIIAEAVCNHISDGTLMAASAGSAPVAAVHPLSLRFLQQRGIATDGLQSQSWQDMQNFNADVVITVCDAAAGEVCPLWLGDTLKVHWGLVDPSRLEGTEADIEMAFLALIDRLTLRLTRLQSALKTDADASSISLLLQSLAEV